MSARLRRLLATMIGLALVAIATSGCSALRSATSASGRSATAAAAASENASKAESSATDTARTPWAAPDFEVVPARATQVIDGDTAVMLLSGGTKTERVRFIGLDAPETLVSAQPFGRKAAEYVREQLGGKRVWLQIGEEPRDRYGRLLAYVWLESPVSVSEAELRTSQLNARLLLGGYARVLTIAPNAEYAVLYRAFQLEAKDAGRGLWGLPSSDLAKLAPTSDNGVAGPGSAAYIGNSNSMKFHVATCKYVGEMAKHHKVPFATRELAIAAGHIPCRGCQP